jgi:phosphoglycerate kinase
MESFKVAGKKVLLRLDINSPIDPVTKKIVNENRIDKSIPTLRWLTGQGAAVAIIAHQGDTLDYQNLIQLSEHAEKLSVKSGIRVDYIDDVCGPAAQEAVRALKGGEAVLLGNLRYLAEEISTFEDAVKLTAADGCGTWLVRSLAPLFDLYINDAFAAAHRNAPSMVSFQEILPSGAGPLFYKEVSALTKVMNAPAHPSVFLLGGAKISDAFGMMDKVLEEGTADTILTAGVTGLVFLIASGIDPGEVVRKFLEERNLQVFIPAAEEYLSKYPGRIKMPTDLAFEKDGLRMESRITEISGDAMYMDIGGATIADYSDVLGAAGTIFINGPAGVFENEIFADGTRELWTAAAASNAFSVVGGGDSVSAAGLFTEPSDFSYICTAGGAMVRFVSGKKLPLIQAMEKGIK